ncbi:MAG: segregation and condensation protein A [Halanaerobiales bacterium]
MQNKKYEIQLDSFQGPLEVLYQLVKKNRIEISEISLARIAEQYLDYMEQLKDFNLELASEFMVIAAELIQIKVRTLLPRNVDEEEEEDSNLVQRLKEYHYFKRVSKILQEYEEKGSRYFPRAVDIAEIIGEELEVNLEIELSELQEAYQGVLLALMELDDDVEQKEDRNWNQLNFEEIKIEDKTSYILDRLSRVSSGLTFSDLLIDRYNRMEVVVTFLSILELAKRARVRIKQEKIFSNINVS